MMSIERTEIIAHIRTFLNNHKGINFPKIGKLSVRKQPARINSFNHTVFPPCDELHFSYNPQISADEFPLFLSEVMHISLTEATAAIDSFSTDIVDSVYILGSFDIKGLGIFLKEKNIIKFIPDGSVLQKSSYGLPEIRLAPLKKAITINTPSENETKTIPTPVPTASLKQSTSWLRIIWDVIASAAIFLLLLLAFKSPDLKSLLFSERATAEKIVSVPEELQHKDLLRLNQKPDKRFINGSFSESDETVVPDIAEIKEPVVSCALILGSFTREYNAARMQQLILETDYELYTEKFQEFFRVGIAVPCDKVNGALFQEIERIAGVDPWLRIYLN